MLVGSNRGVVGAPLPDHFADGVRLGLDVGEEAVPRPVSPPADEAGGARPPRPVPLRQVAPRHSGPQPAQDAADLLPVVPPLLAPAPVARQPQTNRRPRRVCQTPRARPPSLPPSAENGEATRGTGRFARRALAATAISMALRASCVDPVIPDWGIEIVHALAAPALTLPWSPTGGRFQIWMRCTESRCTLEVWTDDNGLTPAPLLVRQERGARLRRELGNATDQADSVLVVAGSHSLPTSHLSMDPNDFVLGPAGKRG